MPGLVADTHAVVWYLTGSPRLSPAALHSMHETAASGAPIFVPTICLVEIVYLVEKRRLPETARARLTEHLGRPDADLKLTPLDWAVADALARVPRDQVPDMPDRIIAATALQLGLPLVTRDGRIRVSNIETIW
jgi:PIN domain nuclease of toxin-antitoxin system